MIGLENGMFVKFPRVYSRVVFGKKVFVYYYKKIVCFKNDFVDYCKRIV